MVNQFVGMLAGVGNTTVYLSIFFVGLMLSKVDVVGTIKNFRQKYMLFVSTAIKLLILPFTVLVVLRLIGGVLDLSPGAIRVLVLQLSMPAGMVVPALAKQYGLDVEYASEGIFIMTILAIATMPFMLWLSELIL